MDVKKKVEEFVKGLSLEEFKQNVWETFEDIRNLADYGPEVNEKLWDATEKDLDDFIGDIDENEFKEKLKKTMLDIIDSMELRELTKDEVEELVEDVYWYVEDIITHEFANELIGYEFFFIEGIIDTWSGVLMKYTRW